MSLLTSTLRRAARHLRGPAPASNPEANRLAALPRAHCDPRHLGYFSPEWLAETFRQPSIDAHWSADRARIDSLGMPDMTGGVNPGDRRALYYLAGRLKPKTILEVGTHIGSSTVALALAAARNLADGITTRIVTVDIRDVNDEQARPWAAAGSPASPAALLQLLGLAESVQFETGTAVERLNAQVGGGPSISSSWMAITAPKRFTAKSPWR